MTTKQIECTLLNFFNWRQNLMVFNITGSHDLLRFETDVTIMSKARYLTGVEIKVSKSDLKADLKKAQWMNIGENNRHTGKANKDEYFGKFKHFYYAVPEFLVYDVLCQVPPWVGIISILTTGRRGLCKVERKASIISNKAISESDAFKIARLGAIRDCAKRMIIK